MLPDTTARDRIVLPWIIQLAQQELKWAHEMQEAGGEPGPRDLTALVERGNLLHALAFVALALENDSSSSRETMALMAAARETFRVSAVALAGALAHTGPLAPSVLGVACGAADLVGTLERRANGLTWERED